MSGLIGREPQQVSHSIVHGVDNYLHGMVPGDFVLGGLTNDFMKCVGHADHINIGLLPGFAMLLYNCVDRRAHGSLEKVSDYLSGRYWDNEQKCKVAWSPDDLAKHRAAVVDYYRTQIRDIFYYDVETQQLLGAEARDDY